MIACIDVLYDDTNLSGRVACVVFEDWFAAVPSHELALTVGNVLPYVPGEFYKRELPCIQAILDRLPALPETIIVDGYVGWMNLRVLAWVGICSTNLTGKSKLWVLQRTATPRQPMRQRSCAATAKNRCILPPLESNKLWPLVW